MRKKKINVELTLSIPVDIWEEDAYEKLKEHFKKSFDHSGVASTEGFRYDCGKSKVVKVVRKKNKKR